MKKQGYLWYSPFLNSVTKYSLLYTIFETRADDGWFRIGWWSKIDDWHTNHNLFFIIVIYSPSLEKSSHSWLWHYMYTLSNYPSKHNQLCELYSRDGHNHLFDLFSRDGMYTLYQIKIKHITTIHLYHHEVVRFWIFLFLFFKDHLILTMFFNRTHSTRFKR